VLCAATVIAVLTILLLGGATHSAAVWLKIPIGVDATALMKSVSVDVDNPCALRILVIVRVVSRERSKEEISKVRGGGI
jgi:hypothetical protein